jgi:CheY-like chemotaxis protein/HPt (histidine-containing phosphotransfer) domain-containing protein
MMGGEIWVESQIGKGSTFHFTATFDRDFSAAVSPDHEGRAQPAMSPEVAHGRASPVAPIRILLVEDEDVSREAAIRLLRRRGHTVTAAADGSRALDVWEASPSRFDIMVTDISMPVMSGLELAREIRQREETRERRLPIIAMTAKAMKGDAERCFEHGIDGYISKPIRWKELLQLIEKHSQVTESSQDPPARGGNETLVCDEAELMAAYDHDQELIADLIQIFYSVYQEELVRLRTAVSQRDAETVARSAHRLKGSVGNLRGKCLQHCAETLEHNAIASRFSTFPDLLHQIEQAFFELKPVLDRISGTQSGEELQHRD